MADIFPAEYVDRLKAGIGHLLDEAKRLTGENGGGFKPASQAHTEHSTYAKPESVYSASAIAVPLIEMAADHLSVFRKILIERVEVGLGRAFDQCWNLARWRRGYLIRT